MSKNKVTLHDFWSFLKNVELSQLDTGDYQQIQNSPFFTDSIGVSILGLKSILDFSFIESSDLDIDKSVQQIFQFHRPVFAALSDYIIRKSAETQSDIIRTGMVSRSVIEIRLSDAEYDRFMRIAKFSPVSKRGANDQKSIRIGFFLGICSFLDFDSCSNGDWRRISGISLPIPSYSQASSSDPQIYIKHIDSYIEPSNYSELCLYYFDLKIEQKDILSGVKRLCDSGADFFVVDDYALSSNNKDFLFSMVSKFGDVFYDTEELSLIQIEINSFPEIKNIRSKKKSINLLTQVLSSLNPSESKLYQQIIRSQLKIHLKPAEPLKKRVSQSKDQDIPYRGDILEADSFYYALGAKGSHEKISNFIIDCDSRISLFGEDYIKATFTTESGFIIDDIEVRKSSFNSAKSFIAALPSANLQWFGNDANTQRLLGIINAKITNVYKGINYLGQVEAKDKLHFIFKNHQFLNDTSSDDEEYAYLTQKNAIESKIIDFSNIDPNYSKEQLKHILPLLPQINLDKVINPLICWFFAAPFRSFFMKKIGHFPHLCIWGTQGSGKSTLMTRVFLPLFGYLKSEPFSCGLSDFSFLKLLGSTNAIPIFIDEYKPHDMSISRKNSLHRYLRRLYVGECETKGRPDLTTTIFDLRSPLIIAGETPVHYGEAALAERVISVNPEKNAINIYPHFEENLLKISDFDLSQASFSIYQYLSSLSFDKIFSLAEKESNRLAKHSKSNIDPRVRDNITTLFFGGLVFERLCKKLKLKIDKINFKDLFGHVVKELFDGSTKMKGGLEQFLEILSTLAVVGKIEDGIHYCYKDKFLCLHLPSCHSVYLKYCREINYEGEVISKRAILKQIQENYNSNSYVYSVNKPTKFPNGSVRRSCHIEFDELQKVIEIDHFNGAGVEIDAPLRVAVNNSTDSFDINDTELGD